MAAAVGHDKLMLGLDGTWAPIKVSGEKIFVVQDTYRIERTSGTALELAPPCVELALRAART